MAEDLILVIRPSDLETLPMTRPASMCPTGSSAALALASRPGLIIVLPAQHFREHPLFAQYSLVHIAAAATTTLIFLLPDDVDELETATLFSSRSTKVVTSADAVSVPRRCLSSGAIPRPQHQHHQPSSP